MTLTLAQQSDILNANDRCDRCGSQAYVLAEGPAGTLLFCGHHFNKSKEKIESWAYNIIDERHKID